MSLLGSERKGHDQPVFTFRASKVNESEKAVQFKDSRTGRVCWLPKSQIRKVAESQPLNLTCWAVGKLLDGGFSYDQVIRG